MQRLQSNWCNCPPPPDCLIRGFKFLVIPSEVKDLRKKTAGIPADAEFLKWWFCFEFFWKSWKVCVRVCSFHWRCDLSPRVLDLFQVICLLRTMVNHPFFTTLNVRILGWNTFFFKTFEVYRVYPSGVVCCFTSCDTPADWDVCCNSQVFIVVEKPRAPAETVVVSSFRGWNATATGLFQRSGWPWAVVEAQLNNTAAPWHGGVWCGKWFKDPNKFDVNLRCTIEERGRDMTTWLRVFFVWNVWIYRCVLSNFFQEKFRRFFSMQTSEYMYKNFQWKEVPRYNEKNLFEFLQFLMLTGADAWNSWYGDFFSCKKQSFYISHVVQDFWKSTVCFTPWKFNTPQTMVCKRCIWCIYLFI